MNSSNTTNVTLVRARLAAVRHVLQRRHMMLGAIMTLGLLAVSIILVDVVDRMLSLREELAFICLALVVTAALLLLARQWLMALFRSPSPVELALAVEREHPEFMDSLVCAVELEAKTPGQRRALEQALVEKVRDDAVDLNLLDAVLSRRLRWLSLLVPALLFSGIGAISLRTPALRKAQYHFCDLLQGKASGLEVQPGNVECPAHSDVRIDVSVRRWEDQAQIVYETDTRETFVMNRAGENQHFFTFYDVTATLCYRIQTPALASHWHTITPYHPPKLKAKRLRIEAPAYTGRAVRSFSDLRDCTAISGSRVFVELDADPAVTITVRHGPKSPQLPPSNDGHHTYEFSLTEDAVLSVELKNVEGRTATLPEFRITAEPDLPPVVDILKPRQDGQIKVGGSLEMEARASDDFGLSRIAISYSVSGSPRKEIELLEVASSDSADTAPSATPTRDEMVRHIFAAEAMGLKEGDVVSYMLVAADNRVPEPQIARSEIYFIVVRPEINEIEASGQDGKQEKLDISGLIAEVKRLIRMTWDILGLPPSEQDSMSAQLVLDLKDLITETRRKGREMAQAVGGDAGPLGMLMRTAEEEMAKAQTLVERKLRQESLQPQERSLAALIALENELIKNAVKSKKGGEGESGEQDEQEDKEQQESEQSEDGKSRQEKLADMRKLLDKLRRLSGQQAALNQTMAQHSSDPAPKTTGKGLSAKQEAVEEDAKRITEELRKIQEAARAAREVTAASQEMSSAQDRLQEGKIRTGERHGRRAHNFLSGAVRSLEDSYRKAAANELSRLSQAAQQLSNRERNAAEKCRKLGGQAQPDADAAAAAHKEQQGLGKMAQELLTQISRTAGEMEESYPEAAEATGQAAGNARQQNLSGKMTRAANALLYQRFDKAHRSQTDAANILQRLASELTGAAKHLPAMSREEMLEALNRIQKSAKEVQQLEQAEANETEKKMEQIRERVSRDVDHLSSALNDPTLQRIGDELAMPMGPGENGAGSQRRLLMLFDAAAKVLERHLFASEMKKRFSLTRRASSPPEKYRRLVEEYFKDLSRER